jgi:hypothetical protein
MNDDETFVDYYELLRVSPGAELESIQRVHRALAARYHPDNTETGDIERFLRVHCGHVCRISAHLSGGGFRCLRA